MAEVLAKLHRRESDDVLLVACPEELRETLSARGASIGETPTKDAMYDAIHLFVRHRADLAARLDELAPHLAPAGRLWVSWPKGRRDGDLTLPVVIEVVYDHRLVESTCLSLTDYWSALKCTHPIPGKSYCNSYGALPGR